VPKHHYVPAALIGRFSTETTLPARRRRIFVARRDKVFAARAEDVGYVRDLYAMDQPGLWAGLDTTSTDRAMSGYEGSLPAALDLLEQSTPVPLAVWLRTLVPWVASAFVRGADFVARYHARPSMRGVPEEWKTPDNTNVARAIEFQLLLAPVMTARWMVLHSMGGESFAINDLGLTTTFDPSTGEWGWAIPLSRSSVLGIMPKVRRTVAQYQSDAWWAVIEHGPLMGVETRNFNAAAARAASKFVAAADQALAERLRPLVGTQPDLAVIMELWPFDRRTLRSHDREWHRLVSATSDDPDPQEVGDLQLVNTAVIGAGWCPVLTLALNLREFPTGLWRDGKVIGLTMHSLTNYEDFIIKPEDSAAPN